MWQAVNRLSLPRKLYGPAVLIFQWAGRRKSEPSDFRSRPEHAPINSRPATTLLLFKVRPQVHLQAESTAKSANREKSPKLAFEPRQERFSGGPWVPDSGQMRVFHSDDERIPKPEDSVADDAVWSEPLSQANFPAIREKYREFRVFEADPGAGSAQNPRDRCAFRENSLETGTGNLDPVTGNCNSLIRVRTGTDRAIQSDLTSSWRHRSHDPVGDWKPNCKSPTS